MTQQSSQEETRIKQIEQKKFISMMNSLTWHIRENIKYQDSIFECLNSDEQKKLFESMKDESREVRITAVVFILYLLYKNEKVLNLIMKRDGLQLRNGPTKYIVGGLSAYHLNAKELIEITKIMSSLEDKQSILCWSINLMSRKVRSLTFEKMKEERTSNVFLYDKEFIDPKENIIVMPANHFDPLARSKITIKSNMSQSSLKSGYSDKIKSSRY